MGEIPEASIIDSAKFNTGIVVPTGLQGALIRRPEWVKRVGVIRRGSLSSEFGDELRKKYGKGVYITFVKEKVLLLLDPDEIRKVLDGSPHPYGHAATKKEKMAHFQPEAVTISPPSKYPERRRFNEAVLSSGRLHPGAGGLHRIVRQESKASLSTATLVGWDELAELVERIALRVIFGNLGDRERRCRRLLLDLMIEANETKVPPRGKTYDEFRATLEAACAAATDDSLAGQARTAQPPLDPAVIPDQITHWAFAMNDTLAENLARAAGLIAGLEPVRDRVSKEIAGADLDDPAAVRRLSYLTGCMQEAMRLWPTTNFIMRRTERETTLCGARVPAGTQVVIVNEINHFDPRSTHGTAPATHFDPERWQRGAGPYHHFGGGTQRCPGEDLALLIANGVLATLHDLGPYRARSPKLDGVDRMPASYNPFEVRLERG